MQPRALGVVVTVALVLVIPSLTGCLAIPTIVAQQSSPSAEPVAPPSDHLPLFVADDAPVTIEIYSDLGCPPCKSFMEANVEFLQSQADAGLASTSIVPVSITDARFGTDKYATRAANAVDCVGRFDPDSTSAVVLGLFDAQPAEGDPGLTDAAILAVVEQSSAASESLADCIRQQSAAAFVASTTQHAVDEPLSDSAGALYGTPTVLVNGEQFDAEAGDAAAFQAFVTAAG